LTTSGINSVHCPPPWWYAPTSESQLGQEL
jgi:hypothetical protein